MNDGLPRFFDAIRGGATARSDIVWVGVFPQSSAILRTIVGCMVVLSVLCVPRMACKCLFEYFGFVFQLIKQL